MSRTDPHPRFHRVSRHIARQIEAGDFAPGERLPSERWFGEALGVSRTTVRRAIRELMASGTIEARGGAMYVTRLAAPNSLLSLTEYARSRGLTPRARVLVARVRAATFDEADAFRIAPGAELFELERLRSLDGAAISIERDCVPLRLLPHALEIDFTTASLYASLVDAGHAPVLARLQIEARAASAREAELLELPPQAPVLVGVERTTDRRDDTIILGTATYRSDRHRFLATFQRTPPSAAEYRRA
jgi:GntR family transcriptional regulator